MWQLQQIMGYLANNLVNIAYLIEFCTLMEHKAQSTYKAVFLNDNSWHLGALVDMPSLSHGNSWNSL